MQRPVRKRAQKSTPLPEAICQMVSVLTLALSLPWRVSIGGISGELYQLVTVQAQRV